MKIFLFSYLNAFSDGKDKLHPGFSVDGTVCILTHTKPWKRQYISIPSAVVRSDHFKARSDFVYLAIADEGRVRYNNLAGGSINLDSLLLTKISDFLKKPLKSFIQITINTTMTKVIFSWPVLAVAIKYLPSTQQECFPEGVDVSPEMLIPSSEGEVVTMEQLYKALEGKAEEELQSFVDAYPNQMDALATAVLAGTLEKVYPSITTEKAASLLPYREEVINAVDALLTGNDDEKLAAVAQLEQLLGDTVAIPETSAPETDAPETPAQAEEPAVTTDAEPTVEGSEVVPAPVNAGIVSAGTVPAAKVGELANHFADTLDNVAAGFRTMAAMFEQPAAQE